VAKHWKRELEDQRHLAVSVPRDAGLKETTMRRLATLLLSTTAALVLLASCGGTAPSKPRATGVATITLELVGGPYPGRAIPVGGTVLLRNVQFGARVPAITFRIGKTGHATFRDIYVGTYRATGSTAGLGRGFCRSITSTAIRSSGVSHIVVTCDVP
jgi:hypothetical protein